MTLSHSSEDLNVLPKITVITVTYNCVSALEVTLKSVLGQNYPNLEYIIIDGKSTDGTWELIQQYQSFLAYTISEKDEGIYDAMNKGIEHTTGQLVNLMNAGDTFLPNTLHQVAEYYQKHPFQLGVGESIWEDENQSNTVQPTLEWPQQGKMFCHQAMFYDPQLHQRVGNYSVVYPYAADYLFVRQAIEIAPLQIFPFPVCHYDLKGVSTTQYLLYAKEVLQIMHQKEDSPLKVYSIYLDKWWRYHLRKILKQWGLGAILNLYRRWKYTRSH